VLYIDDLQWGDTDSAYLISDLLQPPDPPPMLLLTSYRSEDADSPCLRALAETLRQGQAIDRRDLPVAPLTEAETRELVLLLLGSGAEASAAEVARESAGNPFFITELVQEIQSGGHSAAKEGEITLERLIQARVGRLPEGAQRLLEVVAVSGRPLRDAEACRAAGVGADARTLVARLEAARFVRGTGLSEESRLETYHDRIRETVVAGLGSEPLRQHHGRLAQVLEESGRGDPEEMAGHFEGAGELERAGVYYGQAGDRAADALAFDHAAALYQKSLDLRRVEQAEGRDLRRKLGKALANAGRGAEAGPVYLSAAEGTDGQEEFDLRLQAADQLLLSGRTQQGFEVFGNLLHKVGLRLAGGKYRALFGMILERLRLSLGGLRFCERAAESIPAEELMRVDTCEMAYHRLSLSDTPKYFMFAAKYIRLSLRCGEPSRVALGLMNEAFFITATKGESARVRAELVWQKALSLAERVGDPLILAKIALYRGYNAWALAEWKEGVAHFESAELIAVQGQVLHAVGHIKLQHGKIDCLMMLGRWREMGCKLPALLQDAQRRRDRQGTCVFLVHSNVLCLAADRPDDAEAVIRQGWDEWPHAENVMGTYWSLYGRAEAALYLGEGRRAWELIRRERAPLNRATLYVFMAVLNPLMVHLQARTALAAATAEPAGGFFGRRARLLRSAARDARRIGRRRIPRLNPLAKLLRASIANLRGEEEDAVSLLRAAEQELLAADMELYAAAARRQRGKLVGGEEGQTLMASADAWMAGQDIRNPARIAAMLVPGFAD
jgi:hypothetical protein